MQGHRIGYVRVSSFDQNPEIYKAFEHSYSDLGKFFKIALEISAIAGTVWVVKQIYEKKKAQYEAQLKQYFEIENNK